MFIHALNNYVIDDKRNLGRLVEYAKILKIYDKVINIIEVLVNS